MGAVGAPKGGQRIAPWLPAPFPVPAAAVIVAVLLVAGVAWMLGGTTWPNAGTVIVPGTSPTPVPSAASPSPSHVPSGLDDNPVSGTEQLTIVTPPRDAPAGAPQTPGLADVVITTDDPRAAGTGRWSFAADALGSTAVEWGTMHLQNAGGAWGGSCRGGSWGERAGAVRSCWLTGSGGYAGLTYYLVVTQTAQGSGEVEGVIYPGSPVEP